MQGIDMRKSLLLSFIVVIVLILSGCVSSPVSQPTATPTPAPSVTVAPPTLISVSGVVRDMNGIPIQNAQVAIWKGDHLVDVAGNPQYSGSPDGSYNFARLTPDSYQITADFGGHHGAVDRSLNSSANIDVTISDISITAASTAPVQISQYSPVFVVHRTGNSTIEVRLLNMGRATSVRGFYVKTPAIGTPQVMDNDTPLSENETIIITDPNLSMGAHFSAYSNVNGTSTVVVDRMI